MNVSRLYLENSLEIQCLFLRDTIVSITDWFDDTMVMFVNILLLAVYSVMTPCTSFQIRCIFI